MSLFGDTFLEGYGNDLNCVDNQFHGCKDRHVRLCLLHY